MKIGEYTLEEAVIDDSRLIEISGAEALSMRKTFHGEQIRKEPGVSFLGYDWDLMVGTVNGRIYKLSAQFTAENRALADEVFAHANTFCVQKFGQPTEQPKPTAAKWSTPFGNVIVDEHSIFGYHCVNFHVTSGALVRAATPLKSRSGCLGLLAVLAVPATIYFLL